MTWVLIVGSGRGTRFKSQIPKQFVDLDDIPVIAWSILRFKKALPDSKIALTIPREDELIELTKDILKEFLPLCDLVVEGGAHRQESVYKGLVKIREIVGDVDCKVLIHDGVRPFVSEELIKRIYGAIERQKASVPAIQPSDSVRIQTESGNKPIDRKDVFLIQTPQGFYLKDLLNKLKQVSGNYRTDEASLFGTNVNIVEGSRTNIKITYPQDILIAESFIKSGLIQKPVLNEI